MELLAAIFLFATVSSITPGPNNMMIMASGLNHGVRASLPHLLGICTGFPIMVLAVGLGLGELFTRFPSLHLALKLIGILYLLYLAWQIATTTSDGHQQRRRAPFSYLQAAAFQWVNPKAWVMAIGAVAAYTSVGQSLVAQVLLIALIFMLVGLPCVGSWLMFGVGMNRLLTQPRQQQIFNISMGILLAISVLPMLFDAGSSTALLNVSE